MINKLSIFLLLTVLLFSCQQEIDDYYYKDTETYVDSDVMTLLKENEHYSQFVALLEDYQIDTLLDKGNVFTLFVPNNAAMDQMSEATLGNEKLVEYLITESYINLNQISDSKKVQTKGKKFAIVEAIGDSTYTFDGIDIISGSPLANNGRYYELAEVAQPKPNLYEYIADANEFYRNYIDSQDSTYLDKELSAPIGYTDEGLTVYDTVLTTINKFEEEYFAVSQEFRDYKATMLLFTQEQYDEALVNVSTDLGVSLDEVAEEWQNDVLMPHLIEQSVFRNALSYSSFSLGRAKNIIGDSVDVFSQNIDDEYFDCSNGRTFSLIDFQVPEQLYKVRDTIEGEALIYKKGFQLYDWIDGIVTTGQKFQPQKASYVTASGGSATMIDFGKNFQDDYTIAYKHAHVFPGTYRLRCRVNLNRLGVFKLYFNGVAQEIGEYDDIEYDFGDMTTGRNPGFESLVDNTFYPYNEDGYGFCTFDLLVKNTRPYGDVDVKFEYVEPSRRAKIDGLIIDYISLNYQE